jgi:ATP-dependent Lon protease
MNEALSITDNALRDLMRGYCRESGVRNLQKHIEKVRTNGARAWGKFQEHNERTIKNKECLDIPFFLIFYVFFSSEGGKKKGTQKQK